MGERISITALCDLFKQTIPVGCGGTWPRSMSRDFGMRTPSDCRAV